MPFRAELFLIAFTVAIVSLLGMGATLPWFIRVLRVPGPDEEARLREVAAITDIIVPAGEDALRNPELVSADGDTFDPQYGDYTLARRRELANSFVGNLAAEPGSEFAQRSELYRLMLEAEQGAMLLARASVSTRQRRSSTRRWSSTPTWRAWRSRAASPDVDNSVRQEAGCSRSSPPLSMQRGTYAVSESTYSWFSEIHCSTMGP